MKFLWFKHWPILPKIMMISIISISLMIVAITFYFAPLIEDKMMEEKKEGIKNVVDVAFGIFLESDAQVTSGKISIKEAQEQVAERISKLRYSDKEYFWINDLQPIMIMHPIRPELNGKDITDNRDPNGTYLFREFVKVAKSKGAGYVQYMWPKPGETEAVQKVSYIRLYPHLPAGRNSPLHHRYALLRQSDRDRHHITAQKDYQRATDIVIRFGGEEFLVVLLDINENDSMKISEKIREGVQNNKIKLDDGSISKTISLGISEFPTDAGTLWRCIKYADVALYKAKEGGRNRSIQFSRDMWTEDQI